MSGETQSHSRKRRERKKKKGDSDLDKLDVKSSLDAYDEDDSCRDDADEHEPGGKPHHDDHSHGPSSSVLSTVIFFLLLGGLVILTSMIFLELKGSNEVGPPISESRYASILGDFVDEHGHEEDDHDVPQMYTEDEEHENEEDADGGGGDEETHGRLECKGSTLEAAEEPSASDQEEVTEEKGIVEDGSDGSTRLDLRDDGQPDEAREGGMEPEPEGEPREHEEAALGTELEQERTGEEPERDAEPEGNRDVAEEAEPGEPEEVIEAEEEEREAEVEEHWDATEAAEQEAESREQDTEQDLTEVEEKEEDAAEEESSTAAPAEEDGLLPDKEEETDVPEAVGEDSAPSPAEDEEDREGSQDSDIEETTEAQPTQESTRDEATDPYDYEFEKELDAADAQLENSRAAEETVRAKAGYEDVLRRHPDSPRALYGIAMSLDKLSEQQNSNALLERSIRAYQEVLGSSRSTDALFRLAGERCVDRMRFRGFVEQATRVQEVLIRRFPREPSLRNQLAVSYLLLGRAQTAKRVLEEVLRDFPADGFAKVHYGFILKTSENRNEEAIRYLREGIESQEPGTIDGRFYFHLGDALARDGSTDSALKVYEDGVRRGLFLSVYQRSLYNIDGLTGRPWWTMEESTYGKHLKQLEDDWQIIRDEGLALLDESTGGFLPETENLRDTGTWKQFEMYSRGKKIAANCAKAPRTCKLIEAIPDAAGCKRGQVKFSVMHPGTHVWPHTGPTNCRIRAHLGLVVPDGAKIRVANETRFWTEGKFMVFDDSFEHEVWHTGQSIRLVLIVDLWHPELNRLQKETMTPI